MIPAEETRFEIGHFQIFQTSINLTLDRVIQHTVMYNSSTSIYIPNFVEIRKTSCGHTDGRVDGDGWTKLDIKTGFIRST